MQPGLVTNDDFVFIDAGTTTAAMIDFIYDNVRATFVTNGIVHAKKLIQKGLKAYIIGGQIKLTTEAVVGTEAINNLRKYNFTKTFIGTNGVSVSPTRQTQQPITPPIKRTTFLTPETVAFIVRIEV